MTCGSLVLKRRQGIPEEQASQADGNIVDLIAQKMESFGQALLLKRIRSVFDGKFLFVTDGDQKVTLKMFAPFQKSMSPKS